MNQMPVTWLDELKAAYPKRSGPMSWPRVFLKVRRALLETSWDDCIAGVKRYAKYCQEAGIDGSAFVVAPARFFEDQIYLEELAFSPAEDPNVTEHKRKERARFARAVDDALGMGIKPMPGECAAALETRIMLERTQGSTTIGPRRRQLTDANGGNAGTTEGGPGLQSDEPHSRGSESIRGRISSLADRMRVSK